MENKKNERHKVERKIPVFYLLGLNLALLLSIVAFEWKTADGNIIDLESEAVFVTDADELIDIPEPPKSKPKVPKKVEIIETKEDPVDEPPEDADIDMKQDQKIPEIEFDEGEMGKDTAPEPPVDYADKMPAFPGGEEAMLRFINEHVKYPAADRRMGIEGRVYVQFVVEKDGRLTNVQVVKGPSQNMKEEALRVVHLLPDFSPGRLNGKLVRVKYTLPFNFRLQ